MIQKILNKIHKEQDGLMDANGNFEYPEHEGAYNALCDLEAYIDEHSKEPVSEDLKEAANKYDEEYSKYLYGLNTAFKAGANWQKEQFEKNRLSACDAQTKEEAQREMEFVMSIIENEYRQPTYSDAIEYGMRVQKQQMMKNSFNAVVCKICNTYLKEMDKDAIAKVLESYSNGDKVKVIIIKEEEK